jgi:IPT/TIG domain
MTHAELKAAADKAALDKKNEAQIAADQRLAAEELSKTPVIVEGDEKLGGPFSIHGSGFGSSGTLTIGGRLIPTTKWSDTTIKGQTPAGVKGDVVLITAKGARHGTFPHEWPLVTKTTTVTVETVPATARKKIVLDT